MISKYEQASNTRKRGVLGTITNRLVAGQGFGQSIGGGISESFTFEDKSYHISPFLGYEFVLPASKYKNKPFVLVLYPTSVEPDTTVLPLTITLIILLLLLI